MAEAKPKAPEPREILADDLRPGHQMVRKTKDGGWANSTKVEQIEPCGRHHVHVNRSACYDGRLPVRVR